MKRKKQSADFPKKKRKLGKGKRPPENTTRVTFKAQSIVVPTQLEQPSEQQLTTHRNLSLPDLLKQLSHPRASVCCDALNGLRELFVNSAPLLLTNLRRLTDEIVPALFHSDATVHHALFLLLKHVFQATPTRVMAPHIEHLLMGIRCTMTHVSQVVRLTGVKIIDLILTHYPELLQGHINQLLSYYQPLISHLCSPNLFTVAVSNSKFARQETKLLLLRQILRLFTLLSSQTPPPSGLLPPVIDVEHELVLTKHAPVSLYKYLMSSLLLPKLSSSTLVQQSLTACKETSQTCSTSFIDLLLKALLELWMELLLSFSINRTGKSKRQNHALQLFDLANVLVQLLCMLLEIKGHLFDDERHQILNHFLPYFPLPNVDGAINVRVAYLIALASKDDSTDVVYQYLSEHSSQSIDCIKTLTKILSSCNHSSENAKSFCDSFVKLFIDLHPMSSAKQHVLLFIEQVLDERIKSNKKLSPIFERYCLYPCVCSLPNLLLKLPQPVSSATVIVEKVLLVLHCSLSLKINNSVEHALVSNLHHIYGPEGFVTKVPHSLLSSTIQLLGHLSTLTSSDLALLSLLILSDKLPHQQSLALVHLIHNKLITLMDETSGEISAAVLLSSHVSFLLSILIGYPSNTLRQLSGSNLMLFGKQLTFKELSNTLGRQNQIEVAVDCLLSIPSLDQQQLLLAVIEPSLTQLLKSITVFPIDCVYGLLYLFSQSLASLTPSFSQAIAPLLLTCLVAMETDATKHELLVACSSLIYRIMEKQSLVLRSLLELMKGALPQTDEAVKVLVSLLQEPCLQTSVENCRDIVFLLTKD